MEDIIKTADNKTTRHKFKKSVAGFALAFFGSVLVFFGVCAEARAASIYFSPSSGSYKVGQSFTVGVFVSSPDAAMNATDGKIYFPQDKLSVVSVSKSGSISSLWAEEPSFSNADGTVSYAAVILNPGYTGGAGKILSITFSAKNLGVAEIGLSSGSILANDGMGTNIFTGAGRANFTIVPASAEPEKTPAAPVAAKVPEAPKVVSSSHPDPEKWYANKNPVFEWDTPDNITGVSILADNKPSSNPGTRSDGLMKSYTHNNAGEGTGYFHIRLRNSAGWGAISHFKFNVDAEPPDGLTAVWKSTEATDPSPVLQLSAHDATSGIDHYEITAGGKTVVWTDDGTGEYRLNVLDPGDYIVVVRVVDKAGNFKLGNIARIVGALDTPVLTEYPEELVVGDDIRVAGTTRYPDSTAVVYLQQDGGQPVKTEIKTSGAGTFAHVFGQKAELGTYKVWVQVIDSRGAKSLFTDKIGFIVITKGMRVVWEWIMQNLLWIIALIFAAIILWLFLRFRKHNFKLIVVHHGQKDKNALYIEQKEIIALISKLKTHINALKETSNRRRLSKSEKELEEHYKKTMDQLMDYLRNKK